MSKKFFCSNWSDESQDLQEFLNNDRDTTELGLECSSRSTITNRLDWGETE